MRMYTVVGYTGMRNNVDKINPIVSGTANNVDNKQSKVASTLTDMMNKPHSSQVVDVFRNTDEYRDFGKKDIESIEQQDNELNSTNQMPLKAKPEGYLKVRFHLVLL